MVTANVNHEQRPPSITGNGDDDDDETNNRRIQIRLDRLYLENPSYNRSLSYQQYPHSQRTLSPSSSRDMFITSNTVPVYRHGRKFYVSIDEFDRMRADERRHRRTAIQRSQNLPVSKSHSINIRGPPTISLYNPIQRSTSNSYEHTYGVLKAPHFPVNSTVTNNNFNRFDSIRQSRPTYRYSDDRDDIPSTTSALRLRLPTTTPRSNSSDKVLDLRKIPQPSVSSYNSYSPDDYDLKRSISAESVQTPVNQPQTLPRRTVPTSTAKITTTSSDFSMSTATAYPITATDQTYSQSNASKLTSYLTRLPSSTATLNPSNKSVPPPLNATKSSYEITLSESEPVYSVVNPANRRSNSSSSTAVLTRASTHNSNSNEYYFRDTTSGSFSDENSSSTLMLMPRQNTDDYQSRCAQIVVETDDEYRQPADLWSRPTVRSHSSDGLTEKKRVRFADMEGYTLETVPDVEQRPPVNNRLLVKRSYGQPSSHYQEPVQPHHSSFYRTTARVTGNGSKLATDV